MQGDPSVREEPLYDTPQFGGLPDVLEGALVRVDREVFWACQWYVKVAITSPLPVERGRLHDEKNFVNPVSSASMQSTRNRRLTEAQSHLESLLVVRCSRRMTI